MIVINMYWFCFIIISFFIFLVFFSNADIFFYFSENYY